MSRVTAASVGHGFGTAGSCRSSLTDSAASLTNRRNARRFSACSAAARSFLLRQRVPRIVPPEPSAAPASAPMTPIQAASTSGHARFHHGPCVRLRPSCGPFRPSLRSLCGPNSPRTSPKSRESCPASLSVFGGFRPYSLVLGGSLTKSGRTVRVGLNTGDSGLLHPVCSPALQTTLMPGSSRRGRVYAILNVRLAIHTRYRSYALPRGRTCRTSTVWWRDRSRRSLASRQPAAGSAHCQ